MEYRVFVSQDAWDRFFERAGLRTREMRDRAVLAEVEHHDGWVVLHVAGRTVTLSPTHVIGYE